LTEFRLSFQSEAQGESRHFRLGRHFSEGQRKSQAVSERSI
jgi:hypothetical protein